MFVRDWPGYAAQKNFGIERAKGPWIFSLDADERVTPELASEIQETVAAPDYDAYRVFRPTFLMGRELLHYGRGAEQGQVRLFRKGAGRFDPRLVHETVRVSGPIGTLHSPLLHYSYPSIQAYWRKIHHYAALEALERATHGAPRGGPWFRSVGKFGWMMIIRRGIMGGPHAWVWIAGQAYQEWLATGQARRLRKCGLTPETTNSAV